MQRIIRDANRAGDVITRIRAFLQRGELPRSALDLDALVADVLDLVRAEAQARGIALHHAPAAALQRVVADRVQVQQVILNLVMNGLEALQRAGPGARQLTLRTLRHDDDTVRVDVRDNGPGIDPTLQAHLFDAFQTTKPDGLGMGLAISRSIVEAHGGALWATPHRGPGVTFSFTLPADSP